jgi:hypothetical protein
MDTIDLDKIGEIATRVAKDLGDRFVRVAIPSETFDSMGRNALQIEIQLMPGSSSHIAGMAAATTVFSLNKWLQEAGEERLPIVRWIE